MIGQWFAARLGLVATAALVLSCSRAADRRSAADSVGQGRDSSKSTAVAPSNDAGRSAAGRKRILFAGTSLTAGLGLEPDSAYPMLIQRKIDSAGLPFEVTNAGVSGETSSGLLDRLDWLLRGNFDVLVLETGANDGLRGIPTATLRANLAAILDRVKAAKPAAHIAVIQMEALPNLGPRYASEFHSLYHDVTSAKHVTLLPFLLDSVAGRRELNQADGVHPNYRGEPIVADNVWRALRPMLDSIAGAARTRP
jgi:acyl-CoA thioesterase I